MRRPPCGVIRIRSVRQREGQPRRSRACAGRDPRCGRRVFPRPAVGGRSMPLSARPENLRQAAKPSGRMFASHRTLELKDEILSTRSGCSAIPSFSIAADGATCCSHFAYRSLAAGTERAPGAVVINSRDDCHLPFVGFPRRLRHVENDIHQLIRLTLRAAGGRISRSGAR